MTITDHIARLEDVLACGDDLSIWNAHESIDVAIDALRALHSTDTTTHITRARYHVELAGETWTPAIEAALRNAITPLVMEIEHRTMPREVARAAQQATCVAVHVPQLLAWLSERYAPDGTYRSES